ncbi:hypothetical protein PF011_g18769, partial [Phytophthora fragariae]
MCSATTEEGAVSSGRGDDSVRSDEVPDQEPMRKVGSQTEEVTQFSAQNATEQIPHEDNRTGTTAPTPDTVADLEKEEARACGNLADDFEMDEQDLL